jgi:glycine C-acetyltransferase
MLNLCANNYLGLADHPALIAAAKAAMDDHGFGMASVRFICGTQDLHRALETRLAAFLGMDDAILFAACFDANGGLFEPLLGPEDAVISDALNHARSSTASGCARRGATATPMPTWRPGGAVEGRPGRTARGTS